MRIRKQGESDLAKAELDQAISDLVPIQEAADPLRKDIEVNTKRVEVQKAMLHRYKDSQQPNVSNCHHFGMRYLSLALYRNPPCDPHSCKGLSDGHPLSISRATKPRLLEDESLLIPSADALW